MDRAETAFVIRVKSCITACSKAYRRLLEFADSQDFATTAEEIRFFKTMKPQVEGLLLYYNCLLRVELGKPIAGGEPVREYYGLELDRIMRFYGDNRFMVMYYRSGETLLDDKLFTRSAQHEPLLYGSISSDEFSAPASGFAATLLANEKLAGWLNNAIGAITERSALPPAPDSTIRWTNSNAALVELLYALYRSGSFNNGQAALKDIARFLEKAFHVELGNFYRTFQELRIRKKSRTGYLDSLIAGLTQYMDDADLNYKG